MTWWHALFSSDFILVLLWLAPNVWPALRTMLPMVMPTHRLFPTTWSNWLSGKRYYYFMHYTLCYKLLKVFFIFNWTCFLFPSMYSICSCYTIDSGHQLFLRINYPKRRNVRRDDFFMFSGDFQHCWSSSAIIFAFTTSCVDHSASTKTTLASLKEPTTSHRHHRKYGTFLI